MLLAWVDDNTSSPDEGHFLGHVLGFVKKKRFFESFQNFHFSLDETCLGVDLQPFVNLCFTTFSRTLEKPRKLIRVNPCR